MAFFRPKVMKRNYQRLRGWQLPFWGDMCLDDGDLMVGCDQVNFRKKRAACNAVIEGLHVRQGVPVWHCDRIEAAVGAAGVPGAVLFGHQMQERHPK